MRIELEIKEILDELRKLKKDLPSRSEMVSAGCCSLEACEVDGDLNALDDVRGKLISSESMPSGFGSMQIVHALGLIE
jgi:hypothetical protein